MGKIPDVLSKRVLSVVCELRNNYLSNPEYTMPSHFELWKLAHRIIADSDEFYRLHPNGVVAREDNSR